MNSDYLHTNDPIHEPWLVTDKVNGQGTRFAHYQCGGRSGYDKWPRMVMSYGEYQDLTKGVCAVCGQPFTIKGRHDPEEAFQEHYL